MLDEERTKAPENIKSQENDAAFVSLYDWVESVLWALVFVTLVFSFFFRVVGVDGESMLNTLQDGDRLMLVNTFYTPDYGDIVVIRRDTAEPLIKRVIAMEGDVIAIDPENEMVYLNGELLEEPYIDGTTPSLFGFTGPYIVPEGTVFVMGDNRADSTDSRSGSVGPVALDRIMGKAVFRLWPFNQFGRIE